MCTKDIKKIKKEATRVPTVFTRSINYWSFDAARSHPERKETRRLYNSMPFYCREQNATSLTSWIYASTWSNNILRWRFSSLWRARDPIRASSFCAVIVHFTGRLIHYYWSIIWEIHIYIYPAMLRFHNWSLHGHEYERSKAQVKVVIYHRHQAVREGRVNTKTDAGPFNIELTQWFFYCFFLLFLLLLSF